MSGKTIEQYRFLFSFSFYMSYSESLEMLVKIGLMFYNWNIYPPTEIMLDKTPV